MQKIINQLYLFLKRNQTVLMLLGVMTGLLHGDKLFSINSGIDTEKIIFEMEGLYESWLGIGRQGLVLLKWLLGQLNYNPYFAGVLTLLFLVAGIAAFGFLFEVVSGKQSRGAFLLFGGIVIAHPIITEQLYFTLQGAEVTLAFVLTAASLYCAHRFASGMKKNKMTQVTDLAAPKETPKAAPKAAAKRWVWFMGALCFLIPALGVYQAFAPFYLFGIAALGCLRLIGTQRIAGQQIKKELLYVVKLFSVFLVGFILNQGITRMFFTGSDYLAKQIQWDFSRMGEGVRRILSHVRDVALGNGVFYFGTFFWLALGVALLAVWHGGRQKIDKRWTFGTCAWSFSLLLAVLVSPFMLTILMGERPVIRGQLVLPFVTAFMAYFSYILSANEHKGKDRKERFLKIFRGYIAVVGFLAIWQEADVTCRLYYTDAVRFQEDVQLAGHLEQDIAKFTGNCDYRGTVAFVGQRKAQGNCASITGDVMGQSLFAWDTAVEPKNFWSSSRIVGFMHCMGTNYQAPSAEQVALATECAKEMTCYPAEGSIRMCEDLVVVKLSEE